MSTPHDLPHYDRMVKFHKRMDWSVDNSQILVGDSMIQSMNVSYITNSGVNYGISGDNQWSCKPLKRSFFSIKSQSYSGSCRYQRHRTRSRKEKIIESYSELFKLLKGRPFVLSAILPVDTLQTDKWNKYFSNRFISMINAALKSMWKKMDLVCL